MNSHTVAHAKIGSCLVSIEESIDRHNGTVYEREFICTFNDMREPQHSLVEAIEFAQSVTGLTAINPWVYAEQICKQVQEYYRTQGLSQ